MTSETRTVLELTVKALQEYALGWCPYKQSADDIELITAGALRLLERETLPPLAPFVPTMRDAVWP